MQQNSSSQVIRNGFVATGHALQVTELRYLESSFGAEISRSVIGVGY